MRSAEELNQKNLTLIEHLTDLRIALMRSLYAMVVTTGIAYFYSEQIFNILREPIVKYLPTGGLVYTAPMDKFIAHLMIALVVGLIGALPFIFWQIWNFVAPGLYKSERRYALAFIVTGTGLFAAGVAFAYFFAIPMTFDFLFSFGGDLDKPMITIDKYLNFLTQFCLMFGFTFELPLVITFLGMLGLVSSQFLREKRRYAAVLLAIIAALVTPPDALSMTMMFVPLLAFYEISVILVALFEKKRVRAAQNNRE